MANAGIVFDGASEPQPASLLSTAVENDRLVTRWEYADDTGRHRYTLSYRVRAKTL